MFQHQIPQHFAVPMDFDGTMLQQEFNKLSVSPKQPSSPLVPQVQGGGGGGGSGALQGIGAEERISASSSTVKPELSLGPASPVA